MAIYLNLFLEGAGKGNGDYKNWVSADAINTYVQNNDKDIKENTIVLVRKADEYTPIFWESCTKEKKYPKMVLELTRHFRESNSDKVYYRKTLSDAVVCKYFFSESGDERYRATEEITLIFKNAVQEYFVLDEKGNTVKTVKVTSDND